MYKESQLKYIKIIEFQSRNILYFHKIPIQRWKITLTNNIKLIVLINTIN